MPWCSEAWVLWPAWASLRCERPNCDCTDALPSGRMLRSADRLLGGARPFDAADVIESGISLGAGMEAATAATPGMATGVNERSR